MLSLRSHVTTSSTLLCLPSRFHKKLFSLKLLFSLGTIHLCQPHGRKAGGGWGLEICHVPVDSIVFTQHICCSILQMEGVFHKIVDVTHVSRFTQPDSGCSFLFPYFSPIMEFEVHGGSNRKNIDRSCITNEQCE